ETITLLRQAQEIRMLEAVKAVREQQIAEANENLIGIRRSKLVVEIRRDYYRDIAKISPGELLSLNKQWDAYYHQDRAHDYSIDASNFGFLPNLTFGSSGFGGSPHVTAQWGSGNIMSSLQASAGSETQLSNAASYEANMASILAGYERRFDDYQLEKSLADKEIEQLDKSIAAAEL